jgi:hypothetical protein
MKNTIDDATPEEWSEADKANHAASVERARESRAMQGVAAVATGSVAGDQLPQPVFERCRDLEDSPEYPRSERLAFMLGWRWAEKGKPRSPNPFAGIDRDLELMWDAGWHEGAPQNTEATQFRGENPNQK